MVSYRRFEVINPKVLKRLFEVLVTRCTALTSLRNQVEQGFYGPFHEKSTLILKLYVFVIL